MSWARQLPLRATALLSRAQAERFIAARAEGDGPMSDPHDVAFVVRESVPVAERLQEMLRPWTATS